MPRIRPPKKKHHPLPVSVLRFTSLSFALHAFKVTHVTVNECGWGGGFYILGVVYFSLGQSLNLPACPFANFYFRLVLVFYE